jgi:hypothetical protein
VPALVAALLTADRTATDRLLREHPDALAATIAQRPALAVWAAAHHPTAAVELVLDHGFDVNALGRADNSLHHQWDTALHHAAAQGDRETAQLLLSRGADPGIRDARFAGTPLDWARHFGRTLLIDLLEPVTPVQGRADDATRSSG